MHTSDNFLDIHRDGINLFTLSNLHEMCSFESLLRAERRATLLVRGGVSNHGSWRKNLDNSYIFICYVKLTQGLQNLRRLKT